MWVGLIQTGEGLTRTKSQLNEQNRIVQLFPECPATDPSREFWTHHNCEPLPYNELPRLAPCPAGSLWGTPLGRSGPLTGGQSPSPYPLVYMETLVYWLGNGHCPESFSFPCLPRPFLCPSGTLARVLGPACQIFVLSLLLTPGREG